MEAEDRISEVEDRMVEINESERKIERWIKRNEDSPKHPVSCIEPGLAICFIYDIIHVSMPFSQIIPPSPSHTESPMDTLSSTKEARNTMD